MRKKEFDYYIFIDYSEDLIGYNIIETNNVDKILPKISRFRHYKGSKDRKIYLQHIKDMIQREKIKSYFLKLKICDMRDNMEVFIDVLDFINKHDNCIIFICVDNNQYSNFKKLVGIVDGEKTNVVKESSLKKKSSEYQLSLILDNLLNIERRKR